MGTPAVTPPTGNVAPPTNNQAPVVNKNVTPPEVDTLNQSRTTKPTGSKETAKPAQNTAKVDPKTNKPVEAAKNQPKPFKTGKYNLNGKWVEKTWMTEAEMDRDLQKTFGIEEKAQQTAAKVEMAEKLLDYIQGKDPADYKKFVKLCKDNGIDHKKFASDILYDEIEDSNLTPEQRELKVYKEREAEEQAERDAIKAKDDEKANTVKKQQDIQKFEKEMADALAKGGYPKTRLTVGILAQYVEAADAANKESGQKVVSSVEQLLPFVKRDLIQLQQETFGSLEGNALLEAIGPDLLERITKAKVKDYKDEQFKPKVQPKPKVNKNVSLKDNSFLKRMKDKPLNDEEDYWQ